jgi:hypothetical protein
MRITAAMETETPIMIFLSVSSSFSGVLSENGLTGSSYEDIEIKGNPTAELDKSEANCPEE